MKSLFMHVLTLLHRLELWENIKSAVKDSGVAMVGMTAVKDSMGFFKASLMNQQGRLCRPTQIFKSAEP